MTTPNFYTVKPNDNLSGISLRTGVPVPELVALNGIKNPHHIRVGRKLALKREAICGVKVQILDRAHNPIRKLPYVLRYCGKEVRGETDDGGLIPPVVTDSPLDTVTVLLHRAEGDLKEVATVVSGYADKLVTLVSPKLKLVAKTFLHPAAVDKPSSTSALPQPSLHSPSTGQPPRQQGKLQSWWGSVESFFGVTVVEEKTVANEPVAVASDEDADLAPFTKLYQPNDVISDADWAHAAETIGCDVASIKAISKVESRERGFFESNGAHYPIILFERHKFSKWSGRKFDSENPDISSSKMYKRKTKGNAALPDDDLYGPGGIYQYARFKKAYRLDANAAICACSWGKFQVMGENCGALKLTALELMQYAFTSERAHILKMFVPFVLTKRNKYGVLKDALAEKDWALVAHLYNGPAYAENNYDTQLQDFYEKYVSGKL